MICYEEIESLITNLIIASDNEATHEGFYAKSAIQRIETYIHELHKRIEALDYYRKYAEAKFKQIESKFNGLKLVLDEEGFCEIEPLGEE